MKPANLIGRPVVRSYNDIIRTSVQQLGNEYRWRAYLNERACWKINRDASRCLLEDSLLSDLLYFLRDEVDELQGRCKRQDIALEKADAAAAKILVKSQKLVDRAANRDLKIIESEYAQQKKEIARLVNKFGNRDSPAVEHREFDAMVNGQSLYLLDKKALEQLIVSVDWHLSHRDEVKR